MSALRKFLFALLTAYLLSIFGTVISAWLQVQMLLCVHREFVNGPPGGEKRDAAARSGREREEKKEAPRPKPWKDPSY